MGGAVLAVVIAFGVIAPITYALAWGLGMTSDSDRTAISVAMGTVVAALVTIWVAPWANPRTGRKTDVQHVARTFVGQLNRLRDLAGKPGYEELASATGTSSAEQVALVLSAEAADLPSWDLFCEPFIRHCRDIAVHSGVVVDADAELGSEANWRSYWNDAHKGIGSFSPLPTLPAVSDHVDEAERRRKARVVRQRRSVLSGLGLIPTLQETYSSYELVDLWGVSMPICAFRAGRDQRDDPESALVRPLFSRTIPGVEEFSDSFDPDSRPAFDRRVRWYEEADEDERQFLFPAPTYAFRSLRFDADGRVRVECGMGRYFTSLATSEDLDPELMAALARSPDKPVELDKLRGRSWIHDKVRDPVVDGAHRAAAISHATVVMVATGEGDGSYEVLLPARSDKVATHAGFHHVAPSGILAPFDERSPSPESEFSVLRNFYREWIEELYAAKSHERPEGMWIPNPEDEPEITRLRKAIDIGDIHLYYTGMSVNLLTLRPEVCLLLLVDNPDWLKQEQRIARESGQPFKFNWEYATGARQASRVAPEQSDHWQLRLTSQLKPWDERVLQPTFLVPNAAAAIWLAIETMQAMRFPDPIP